jgi:YHS domain-containing protein
MINALLISITLLTTAAGGDNLSCAVMGSAVPAKPTSALDYAGVRYSFCCGGCDATFKAEPKKFTKAPEGKVIGHTIFDYVSGARLDEKKIAGSSDYKGVRYRFASEANLVKFKADPKAYSKTPEKEVMHCVVMGHDIANYAEAGSFADYEGVRYYMCCGDCAKAFQAKPADYAAKFASKATAPVARTFKQ